MVPINNTTYQSHSGVHLAEAFAKVLEDFGITDKVSAKFHI
jgi:hypothetical protein